MTSHKTVFFLFQVLVLRELAVSAPTFFFQQVQPFFDNIFYAVWDPKQAIREGAVSALRACLILTTQRETKEMQKPQWYKVWHSTVSCQITFSVLNEVVFISICCICQGETNVLLIGHMGVCFSVTANL